MSSRGGGGLDPAVPGADLVTARAVIVEDSRLVVPRDRWLSAAARYAAEHDLLLQIETRPDTRFTMPAVDLLASGLSRWVVADSRGEGVLGSDGLTGESIRFDGQAWVAGGVGASLPRAAAPDTGCALITLDALHPATEDLQLGGLAATCFEALTGQPPTGWGSAEPVSERWQPTALTRFVRGRSPAPTQLVLTGRKPSGPPAVGLTTVTRRPAGVHERLQVKVGLPGPPDVSLLEQVARAVNSPCLRTAVLGLVPGPTDTTTPVHPIVTSPFAVLLGPAVVAEVGERQLLARTEGYSVRRIGSGPSSALLVQAGHDRPLSVERLLQACSAGSEDLPLADPRLGGRDAVA